MQNLEEKQFDCIAMIQKLLTNYKKCAKDKLTRGYSETRLELLELHWKEFQESHNTLMKLSPDEKHESKYFGQESYDSCLDLYLDLKTRMKDNLNKLDEIKHTASAPTLEVEAVEHSAYPTTKLPPIKLPTFSGDYRDWLSFHDLFKSLVHDNPKVSKVNKCQHLKSSLQGEAESLVRQIQVSEANYDIIWSMLIKRYNNKRSIVNTYLGKLLHQKRVTQETSKQIRELLDTTTECLATLKSLEFPTESWDDLVVFIVIEKLDPESHKMFEQRLESTETLPTWEELSSFLEFRFRTLEAVRPKEAPVRHATPRSFATELSQTPTQLKCIYCSKEHHIFQCQDFRELELTARKEYVQKNQMCFNCLRKGHPVKKCLQSTNCKKCGRKHHSLLHGYTPTASTEKVDTSTTAVCNAAGNFKESRVVLATALVKVRDETGHTTHTLRALVDQGSQASLITEAACQSLGFKRVPTKGSVMGVGECKTATRGLVEFDVSSTHNPNLIARVRAYVMASLTSYLPQHSHAIDWPLLRELELADPNFYVSSKIDLILGADVHAEILEQGLITYKNESNTLVAQKTTLGWLISGKHTTDQSEKRIYVNQVNVEVDILRRFWELEEHTGERTLTKSELQCEEHYQRTHHKAEGGSYQVRLPFTTQPPDLGESLTLATRRLAALERKLERNTELRTRYNEFMDDYIEQQHMQLVTEEEIKPDNETYYFPHHAVINEQHLTTKLRVVFDGSAKTSNNKSLNDNLHTGPPLQSDLRDVTLRWRQHPVVLVGDIRQMFRRIQVDPRDRDYQRILWRKSTMEPIQHYQLTTVTYGSSCAPYLAIRTLKQVAMDQKGHFPDETVRTVLEDFYMDDLLTGSFTPEKVIDLRKQLIALLSKGGFTLHKWASNHNIEDIEQSTRTILGLKWDGHTDKFEIKIDLPPMSADITKRAVLCDIARIYDPNGWLAPAVITAKSMLQKLWIEKVDWDETLPEPLLQEWVTFRRELTDMPTMYLDRWLGITEDTTKVELHGFSDASAIAYSAVVYCRVIKPTEITVTLVESKTRVAPVKQISLPRLELCGAVLLANLIHRIQKGLNIPSENVHAWTDATIVLAWLQKAPSTWTIFVANRVTEITNLVEKESWHHVPTQDNPADVASRGISPLELPTHPQWWHGPTWLRATTAQPDKHLTQAMESTDLERKATGKDIRVHVSEVNDSSKNNECKDNKIFTRYSTLNKLIRVVARMMRFYTNLKSKLKTKNCIQLPEYLCTTELKLVLQKLILLSQQKHFNKERNVITSNKSGHEKYLELKKLTNGSKIAKLNPFLDDENVLRVGGRIHFSELNNDTRHPVILTSNCKLAELIVKDAHSKTLHGGVQLMINCLRSKFHIIGLRNLVKKVIHGCISCRRYSARLSEQMMGNLPKERVNPQRAFAVTGVDMAGPITLKLFSGRSSQKTQKGYIAVFICTAIKAIHLELVTSLSSEGFLAAFRRFTSRRGHCQKLISDCGTNFIGASKELRDMFKSSTNHLPVEIANLLAKDGTEWQFNPAGAPHMGGLWESAVKSVKHHLNRVLNETKLTYEEYSTLLCQVEACLNSRPLTPSEGDDGNVATLTPGHFLIGEIPITVPEENLESVTVPYLKRWTYLQQKLQMFWRKWSQEYLVNLQKRYKWTSAQDNVKIGDIVLVKDERLPPGKWLLGRIINTHPGSDGLIRVVTLKCNNHEIKRPIHKLVLLPIDV